MPANHAPETVESNALGLPDEGDAPTPAEMRIRELWSAIWVERETIRKMEVERMAAMALLRDAVGQAYAQPVKRQLSTLLDLAAEAVHAVRHLDRIEYSKELRLLAALGRVKALQEAARIYFAHPLVDEIVEGMRGPVHASPGEARMDADRGGLA